MSGPAAMGVDLEVLRAELAGLSWPGRFERLAREEKGAPAARKLQIERLREALADQALDELRPAWGRLPLKAGVLQLESKRMRGALGRAAKRARDRAIADYVAEPRFRDEGFSGSGGIGAGLDERVVEIPLALRVARLDEPGTVLDAGSALNLPIVRQVAGRPAAHVTHFTMPGSIEPHLPGDEDRYRRLFGDLRAMPFADASFDRVVCVSTLEHVGLDNSRFGAAAEAAPDSAPLAVAELVRVLAPGGRLLLTVPYGVAASHGWFRVFDREGLHTLLAPLRGLAVEEQDFFYDGAWRMGEPPAATAPAPLPADVITGVAIVTATRRSAP